MCPPLCKMKKNHSLSPKMAPTPTSVTPLIPVFPDSENWLTGPAYQSLSVEAPWMVPIAYNNMPSDMDDLEGLSTDLGSEIELGQPCDSSPWRGQTVDPDFFTLHDDYLIYFNAEGFECPSTEVGPEQSGKPQEMDSQKPELGEGDAVVKYRVESGMVKRSNDGFEKKKQTRAKLGKSFGDFLKRHADQEIDDFLTSLSRDFLKKLCFCVKAEALGFDKAFKDSVKLHSRGTKNVKVPACDSSKERYQALFALYTALPEGDKKMPRSYERSISSIKKTKHFKSFNVAFQRYFYTPLPIRILFKHYLDFLDNFSQSGRELSTHLRISKERPEAVKTEMTYEYMAALGLEPYDGLCTARVFKVTVVVT